MDDIVGLHLPIEVLHVRHPWVACNVFLHGDNILQAPTQKKREGVATVTIVKTKQPTSSQVFLTQVVFRDIGKHFALLLRNLLLRRSTQLVQFRKYMVPQI